MSEQASRNAKAEAKAAKAYAKAERPWFKKKRWIFSIGIVLLFVVAGPAGSGGGAEGTETEAANTSQDPQTEKLATEEKPAADKKPVAEEKPAVEEEPAPKEPEMTSGQKNALEAAENYIELSGFSRAGLISQLSSSAGDGYSKADATFAANNVDVDYKKEAVESAKNYLELSSFSKDKLIEQLSSSAGDKYTEAQARYAASKVY